MAETTTQEPATFEERRAIDTRIAEQVMGWETRSRRAYDLGWHTTHEYRKPEPDRHGLRAWQFLPLYSKRMDAAWEILEKLIADGWFPEVQFNNWGAESWHVTLEMSVDAKNWRPRVAATGATAALAICRAALLAVAPRTDAPYVL